jgi:hypothetical protein
MHTTYSDGTATHAQIANAALKAGIDAVIVTDHNVYVDGLTGYHRSGEKQVLLIVGEEIHDQIRNPQKNHMLVVGGGRELAKLARDPQNLIDNVNKSGGLTFIAHPIDPESPMFGEPNLSWVSWEVHGFTGIELWNAMSEFKSLLHHKPQAIFYAFNPRRVAKGPFPETLRKWDELLSKGRRVIAVGGSDAHAFKASLGPIRRRLFPYEFHFRSINTHLLVDKPLKGEKEADIVLVQDALREGHAFIGYDLPSPTRGFRFVGQGIEQTVLMGDQIKLGQGVTLQITLPKRTECRLLKDGKIFNSWNKREIISQIVTEPGVYRVEVYLNYLGKRRGWIFSNPIYIHS